jgi:uncharacterized protein (DUF697 family)/predicted GTPase
MPLADVEARLDRIVRLYEKIDELLDKLPVELPKAVRKLIAKAFRDSNEMKELMDAIKERRAPRFVLVGRTGVGKSSLINAMCSRYLAKVSDVDVGTTTAQCYSYKLLGRTLFEVVDTRGAAESLADESLGCAEREMKETIEALNPDAILFLVRCKERAHLDKDIEFLKKTRDFAGSNVPILALLTQCDEMEPSLEKMPSEYSHRKLENIEAATKQLKELLSTNEVDPVVTLAVSSLIQWDGHPHEYSPDDWGKLRIKLDCRYNIDQLLDALEKNIDLRAGIFLSLTARVDQAIRRICKMFARVFAAAAAAVAATPIPLSDIYILVAIQASLVMLIAFLAGRDLDYKSAIEAITAMGGSGAAGIGFRAMAQQAAKALNLVIPGAGSVASSGIASAGTYGIGIAAVAYFVDGATGAEARKAYEEGREWYFGEDGANDS